MNKYVVAHWSDHTGELLQELVEANTEVEAVLSYMQWDDPTLTSMAALHSYAANCDSAISVISVKPAPSKKYTGWAPEALQAIQ